MGARTDDPEDIAVEPGPVIYTVGTSTRSLEEFLDLLRAYGIEAVLDVRRFPTSRRYPHFSSASLASSLAASGITYHYLGDSLGGYRREGYEAYTRTPAFRQGLEQAMDVAARGRAAIMCCERFPWRCHRRFIAGHLADLGWQVVHILDHQRTYLVPRPTSGRNEPPQAQA